MSIGEGTLSSSYLKLGKLKEKPTSIPGEGGIWVFLFGDLSIFTALFGSWMYYRAYNVEEFLTSQATLSETLATLNTILLLMSSWCVVMAIESARSQKRDG